jgi:hypothetical protein
MLLAPALELAAAMTAAGVPTTTDPRTLTVPGAIVTPVGSDPAGVAAVDVELEVTLLAPGPANGNALAELDRLDDLARATLLAPGRLVGYEHPATGDTLAGWQYTLTRTAT